MRTPNGYIAPEFYNKTIEEINDSLSALGWIEYIHPLARTGVDEQGTFPEVYLNDGSRNSIRIMPHGKSLSFFTMSSSVEIDESEYYAVEMSLIVWADMTKVYPAKAYDYTTELIKDVKNVLNEHGAYDKSIDHEGVFDGFTELEKVENQNTMFPRTAFKINFTIDVLFC